MHGFNHPKPIAVAALAHQLCRVRFDTTLPPLEELVGVLPDPLASGVIWPVHRPIALRLGVPATNVVKVNDTYVQWEDFVHGCYKGWALNGLTSETATTSAPVSPSSRHTLLTLAGRSTS